MKKTNKENPITTFRKANEARQAVVKKSLKKAQDGIQMNSTDGTKPPGPPSNTIGANFGVGNFSGGVQSNLSDGRLSNTMLNAAYNNPKGFGANVSYSPQSKQVNAGLNYNTTVGKNKIPLKLGITYNKTGGSVKRKKK
jgi:hypothetical protein